MDDYFLKFEDRKPPEPLPYSAARECLWQFLATIALIVGGWYIWWRWAHSLNPDAMWFAIPLVLAESFAFFGMILFVFNLWKDEPVKIETPTETVTETETPEIAKWEWLEFVVEDEVREQISEGLVIVVMHRHDCSVCVEMAPKYSEYYAEMLEQGVYLAPSPYEAGFVSLAHKKRDIALTLDAAERALAKVARAR